MTEPNELNNEAKAGGAWEEFNSAPQTPSTHNRMKWFIAAGAAAGAAALAVTLVLLPKGDAPAVSIPEPTPTSISETEAPFVAPDMKPFILSEKQLADFNSTNPDIKSAVLGETIIPAVQAYIDNLAAAQRRGEDVFDVDFSSITSVDNPSTLVTQLRSLVKNNSENDAYFIVCGTNAENTPEICLDRRYTSISDEDGFANRISIIRTDVNDPYGVGEENNISIELKKGNGVLSITPEGQIVVN